MRWRKKFTPHDWRPWFAWRPVNIAGNWVWLETVERVRDVGALGRDGDSWRYRDVTQRPHVERRG